jgi:hypothetical protein
MIISLAQPDYDDLESGGVMMKPMARGKSDKGKDNKKFGKHSSREFMACSHKINFYCLCFRHI